MQYTRFPRYRELAIQVATFQTQTLLRLIPDPHRRNLQHLRQAVQAGVQSAVAARHDLGVHGRGHSAADPEGEFTCFQPTEVGEELGDHFEAQGHRGQAAAFHGVRLLHQPLRALQPEQAGRRRATRGEHGEQPHRAGTPRLGQSCAARRPVRVLRVAEAIKCKSIDIVLVQIALQILSERKMEFVMLIQVKI